MVNHSVRVRDPLALWKEFNQISFDFDRIRILRQSKTPTDPANVGIDDDSRGNPKCGSEHDVGSFPADSGEHDEQLELLRDFAVWPRAEITAPTSRWSC